MKNVKVLGIVLAVLLAIGFYALPYVTVAQMQRAASANDGEALSEHIDFPSVRQSLKDQLNAMFADAAADHAEKNPFGILGAAVGGLLVDKMVDVYVTPAGLTRIMRGESPDGAPGDTTNTTSTASGEDSADSEPFHDASLAFASLSKFTVTVKDKDSDQEIRFILRRSGLSWKMTEILLPL